MAEGAILVVEDEQSIASLVSLYLSNEGFEVHHVSDGARAVSAAERLRPALVVLDLMLPGIDGLEICRRLRQVDQALPIVVLTARDTEVDRVLGLELGADDYVIKPFSPRELVLRVGSLLRRSQEAVPQADPAVPVVDGGLQVDLSGRRALLDGRQLALTVREFDLLAFLIRHPEQVFSRAELLERVWGWDFGDQSTVTVHVRRLRRKVEEDPTQPRRIATVWGIGYRYDPVSKGT